MNKRDFITGALALPALAAHAAPGARMYSGPGLLTICGDVGRTNRGPLDPALDQMMVKHGLHFTRAFVFDTAALHGLIAEALARQGDDTRLDHPQLFNEDRALQHYRAALSGVARCSAGLVGCEQRLGPSFHEL